MVLTLSIGAGGSPFRPRHVFRFPSRSVNQKKPIRISIGRVVAIAVMVCFALSGVSVNAQESSSKQRAIPSDTSFTLGSTAIKVYKQYPSSKLVEPKLPDGVVAEENIVYMHYGERELHLDLFSPRDKGKGTYPAVILVHGGGWRSGYRQMEWPMAQQLAANGYVVATVEYRLSVEALYPAGIYDLKAAVQWVRANASRISIDPDKIAVYGCSAGGELAAFLGTTGDMKKFEGSSGYPEYSSSVQAVIDVDGVVDLTAPAESAKDDDPKKPSAGKSWFGASFTENPEIWREASPINYADRKTPPILFINSSLERYHAGRDEMIAQLNKLGIYSEVHTIPDSPHPFWLFHPWFQPTLEHTLKFLNKTLKGR